MNLLWRDNFGSFFDSSVPEASGGSTSFAGTDAAAGWSGQSLLWSSSDAASRATDLGTIVPRGLDVGMASLPSNGSGLLGQDMLWVEPSSSAGTWRLADSTRDASDAGVGTLATTPGLPDDVRSLVWDAILSRFEEGSAIANSSTLDATLNQILDVLWTRDGGTGQPPVTLPHAPSNPLVNGFVQLAPSDLVWTDQPHLAGSFPDGAGQPPLAPPAADNRPVSFDGGHVAPDNLLWTDPSQSVPVILNNPAAIGTAPTGLLNASVQSPISNGMPISGAGSR
jgi:hypothetical protein